MSSRSPIDLWRRVFDLNYNRPGAPVGTDADVRGWIDPATRTEVPLHDMEDWLNEVSERIEKLAPTSVIEIGAGTGNLAVRLAPSVERYTAVDISRVGLAQLARRATACGCEIQCVESDAATYLRTHIPCDADVIVLNSVIQYFPSAEYTLNVLRLACNHVGPRGSVFVGDITNASLARHHRSGPRPQHDVPSDFCASALQSSDELMYAPSFFRGCIEDGRAWVAVPMLKLTRADHSLARFRYDVVLSATRSSNAIGNTARVKWQAGWAPTSLTLLPSRVNACIVEEIPNLRIVSRSDAPHPADLCAAATDQGWAAYCVWLDDAPDGRYAAICVRAVSEEPFDAYDRVKDLMPTAAFGAQYA